MLALSAAKTQPKHSCSVQDKAPLASIVFNSPLQSGTISPARQSDSNQLEFELGEFCEVACSRMYL
jgi:hypothetical protein